jgi:subfamily B ATP-binding cassette protein MsbA
LLAFFACFGLMINPVRNLNDANMKLNLAGASADRIDETLKLRSEIQEKTPAIELSGFSEKIEFKDVSFYYSNLTNARWVFENINFEIKRGQTVALVGASGQGKSTLINLLPRYYDPKKGKILIDGLSLSDLSLISLRKQISVVTQDVFLFNDSIYNNVFAANPTASEKDVLAALEAAQAMGFIANFPNGVHTNVGDRGQKLSGGERQRVSIARAILKNAPILVLDEATSSLDSESEKAVQKALDVLMHGKTTLVIAHRLSTIKHADQILVLSHGKIIESGTHQELMQRAGEYKKFYELLG